MSLMRSEARCREFNSLLFVIIWPFPGVMLACRNIERRIYCPAMFDARRHALEDYRRFHMSPSSPPEAAALLTRTILAASAPTILGEF
jgi:hypothetical protein